MPTAEQKWTPAEDALALRLVREGKSRAEIGRTVGRSRNAVIGRLMRLAEAGEAIPAYKRPDKAVSDAPRPEPRAPRAPRAAKASLEAEKRAIKANTGHGVYSIVGGSQKPWRPANMAAFTPLNEGERLRLTDRPAFTCAWPVGGEGADTLCCGERTADESPYCLTHRRMAYVPTAPLDKRLFRMYA